MCTLCSTQFTHKHVVHKLKLYAMSTFSCTVVHYCGKCAQSCTIVCTVNELVYAHTIVYDFRCVPFCTSLSTNSCATVYEFVHKVVSACISAQLCTLLYAPRYCVGAVHTSTYPIYLNHFLLLPPPSHVTNNYCLYLLRALRYTQKTGFLVQVLILNVTSPIWDWYGVQNTWFKLNLEFSSRNHAQKEIKLSVWLKSTVTATNF